MNLSQFRRSAAWKLGYSTTDSDDLAVIDAWVNEGYEDVLSRTQCKIIAGTLTTSGNEWKYELPTEILAVTEVWVEDSDGQTIAFERTTEEHILRLRAGITTEAGSQIRYFATAGANFLLLWPTPTTSQTIHILYVPRPTALSATGDSPSYVPSEWHKAIEYYMLWQAADAEDSNKAQSGEYYRQLYEGKDGSGGYLDRIRQSARKKGGRMLGPVTVIAPFMPVRSRSSDVGW